MDSEVVTPSKVADQMMATLPAEAITNQTKILDIAAKQGEFATALYKRFGEQVKQNVYSVVTSPVAYEFTRKIYEMLGMPIEHIFENFNSYDIIGANNQEIIKQLDDMKFNVIVGNPPYQESDGGAQASARPIYHLFVDVAKQLQPDYISMIMPSRWYAGGKGLDEFRETMLNEICISELHDFLNPETVFPNTNNRGGVCFFLYDSHYNNKQNLTKVITYKDSEIVYSVARPLKTNGTEIFIRHQIGVSVYGKIQLDLDYKSCSEIVSSRKPFGVDSSLKSELKNTKEGMKNPIKCYGRGRHIYYIEKSQIPNQSDINSFKLFTPRANNIGTELNDDNLNTFIGKPMTICTESYMIIGANTNLTEHSANNITKYLSTKFARFLHSIGKCSQDATSKTYKFVPLQDFTTKSDIDWSKPIPEIDKQLYAKYGLTKDEIAFIESMIKPME